MNNLLYLYQLYTDRLQGGSMS